MDSVTGVVTVTTPLQVKIINLEAVASIPSGVQDKTTVCNLIFLLTKCDR